MHAADSGDDPVGLAQAFYEPRDDDDLAAMAFEEAGGLVDPVGREEDVATEAFDQRPSPEVSDGKADVVAEHGG